MAPAGEVDSVAHFRLDTWRTVVRRLVTLGTRTLEHSQKQHTLNLQDAPVISPTVEIPQTSTEYVSGPSQCSVPKPTALEGSSRWALVFFLGAQPQATGQPTSGPPQKKMLICYFHSLVWSAIADGSAKVIGTFQCDSSATSVIESTECCPKTNVAMFPDHGVFKVYRHHKVERGRIIQKR